VAAGAELLRHRPGRLSVIRARYRADAEHLAEKGWACVPYGMEHPAYLDRSASSAQLPCTMRRIVVPVGSGITLAAILRGLNRVKHPAVVLGVRVGGTPSLPLTGMRPAGLIAPGLSPVRQRTSTPRPTGSGNWCWTRTTRPRRSRSSAPETCCGRRRARLRSLTHPAPSRRPGCTRERTVLGQRKAPRCRSTASGLGNHIRLTSGETGCHHRPMEYFTLAAKPTDQDAATIEAALGRAWNACAGVACSKCHVPPWQYCRNRTGGAWCVTRFHRPRQDAAAAPGILAPVGIYGLVGRRVRAGSRGTTDAFRQRDGALLRNSPLTIAGWSWPFWVGRCARLGFWLGSR